MPIDPQAVSSATVRRVLAGAGPSVATQLRALSGPERVGAGLLSDTAAGLVQRTEASKAWALETSAREGARLLYEAARACLAGVSDYAPLVEWVREPEALGSLQRRFGRLGNRAHGLGGRFQRFPSLEHGLGPRLARECLQIARAMDPDLLALQLQEGCVAMAKGDWNDAISAFEALLANPESDEFLRHFAARNTLMSLVDRGQVQGREDLLERLSEVSADGSLVGFFRLELAAASGDRTSFGQAVGDFVELRDAPGPACKPAWIEARVHDWSRLTGQAAPDLQEALLEGWS